MEAAQGLIAGEQARPPEQTARAYAQHLLDALGVVPARALELPDEHPALSWAGSGLMALTGRADGPARMLPSALAAGADGALAALASLAPTAAALDGLRGSRLLAERAAFTGFQRNGAISAGGSCRLLATADGVIALNLAREDDWAALPAWLETEVAADWDAVAAVVRLRPANELTAQGRLLGLAVAASPESETWPWLRAEPVFPLSPRGRGVGERGARSVPLSFAKELRVGMTDAEKTLWYQLRAGRLNGHKFKRQAPLGPYILDFVCFGSKLVVELDGSQHLESAQDGQRDAWLRSEGFRVARFWNNQVLGETEAVLAEILRLVESPLSPTPLPQGERGNIRGPRVIDLSSLWAGPLCGHLLHRLGAEVVKVESLQRPDGARRGSPEFFDLLNAGKRSVALDLSGAAGRARLRTLLSRADIVIEGSRPRALRQMGLVAEEFVQQQARLTWLSLTGYGREPEWEQAIAYGDDAGVAAGLSRLLQQAHGETLFCGDAIADPLTGIHAALAGWASWLQGGGGMLSLSLCGVVRSLLDFDPPDGVAARAAEWAALLDRSGQAVAAPRARAAAGKAAALGADTGEVLADWNRAC
ncbi:MAG: CoA transferase [Stagnimonas sp.]|nr:CoA transferase [Stagnimonas sp.]